MNKILFSLTYYTPYVSGLTLYVKRLAEALVEKSFQISVISFQYDKKLKTEEAIGGVNVIRVRPLFKISKGFFSFDWMIKSWQEVKKSDVVIINLPQFEGIVPAIFGKILGKRIISIYHCEIVLPSGLLNSLVQILLTISNFVTLAISDKVVTYTEDFARHSKVLRYFSSKLKFIYPPILIPKINKRIQKVLIGKIGEVHSRPGLEVAKGRAFIIGVAARMAAEKGIEYVLESIPILNSKLKTQNSKLQVKIQNGLEFKIIIAGSLDPVGEQAYKEKILRLVEKYKDYVVFLGELKEEEMGSFYSLLDLLVLPSVNSTEAFGMVQVEAMMMGVPVVATDMPGVRIPIEKTGMGVLVPIKNSQKLAEAIAEVFINKKKYIKDTSLIKKEFSFEKTIEFYQKLWI